MRRRADPLADPGPLLERVYAYVAYRIGPGPAAEDVASEVVERALRYRDSYDPRRGDPIAWAIGIARRCVEDARAERRLEPLGEEGAHAGFAESADGRVDLRRAVAALGERERELIALRYGADLGAAEIGELLGMKAGAVRVALHRALDRLRESL